MAGISVMQNTAAVLPGVFSLYFMSIKNLFSQVYAHIFQANNTGYDIQVTA